MAQKLESINQMIDRFEGDSMSSHKLRALFRLTGLDDSSECARCAADEEEVAASAVPSGSSSPAAEVRRMQEEEEEELQTKPSRTASGGSVSCDTHAIITLTSHACRRGLTDLQVAR